MKRFESLMLRLKRLETRSGISDTVLFFADGSSRVLCLSMADQVKLLSAAVDRLAYWCGPGEGFENEHLELFYPSPFITSPHDKVLDMFAECVRIEGRPGNNLPHLIKNALETAERDRKECLSGGKPLQGIATSGQCSDVSKGQSAET